MRNVISQGIRMGTVLGLGLAACGGPTPEELPAAEDRALAEQAWQEGRIVEIAPTTLAAFNLSNGSTVHFVWLPGTDQVGVGERAPLGVAPVVGHETNRSPLERYLSLAAPGAAVPRQLVDASRGEVDVDALVAGRTLVETVQEVPTIQVDQPDGDRGDQLPVGSGPLFAVGYCTSDANGVAYFKSHSCKTEDLRNSFCDAGSFIGGGGWITLIRDSSDRKYKSYSRTASCASNGQVKHYYWNGSSWNTTLSEEIPFNDQEWWTYSGGAPWYRRIKHYTHHQDLGGFVRAWSEFHN